MAGIRGLAPATHSVPLALGIDTENNPVLVGEGRWTLIQNATFSKGSTGQLHTRNGSQSLATACLINGASSNLTSGQSLAQLTSTGELDVYANGALFVWSPTMQTWIQRATITACVPSRTQIVRNNYDQSAPDAATLNNVTVYAWQDARGGVWFKVVDQASGTVIQSEAQLDSTASQPRIVTQTAAGLLTIVYSTTAGAIKQAPIATASPATAPTTSNIVTGLGASPAFEITPGASYFLLAFMSGAHPNCVLLSLSSLAASSLNTLGSVTAAQISCCVAGNGNFVVAAQVTGVGNQTMYVWFLNPTTNLIIENYSHLAEDGPVMTVAPSQAATTAVITYVSVPAGTGGQTPYIAQCYWDQSAGFVRQSVTTRGCGLVGLPFLQGGVETMLVTYISEVQPTYFLLQLDQVAESIGTIIGRYVALDAGAVPPVQRLAQASSIASGQWLSAISIDAELESVGGSPVIVTGIDALTLDFTQTSFKSIELGRDLTISGGLPQLYDGEFVNENGFNVFPEAPTCTLLTSQIGITNIVDGTPSVAQSVTITFPINQDGSGFDGALIQHNEYITFGDSSALWFNFSDAESEAPTYLGMTLHSVYVAKTFSAEVIASGFAASLNYALSGTFSATANGNQVVVTAASTGILPRPQTFSQFNLCMGAYGSGDRAYQYINCIPGNLIQPGQYFNCVNYSSSLTTLGPFYVWFAVSYNGGTSYVGTDPAPANYLGGLEVQIQSTWNEVQVASALATALNDWINFGSASSSGPIVTANGYNTTPVNINVGSGLGVVGGVASNQWGSVTYATMFEAQDTQGQWARSGLSEPVVVAFPDYGLGNAQVLVQQQPLYLTARNNVDIAVYRTTDLGDLLYRASPEDSLIYNNANDSYISFYDSVPDTTLESNELCYSQPLVAGSVIENSCPPAFTQSAIFTGQDQMWINDCEDPTLWWWSKAYSNGVQVEWSNEQTTRFDPSIGNTVAALAMDANMIVFGASGIAYVNGLGPDSTGAGQPFTVTNIPTGLGLRDPNSLVLLPIGIMFMSAKGIQLLSRGLQIAQRADGSNWGSPVGAYNGNTIVSAKVVPGTTEVRFLCSTGVSLVYDYQYDQWSTNTGMLGVDSIIYQGTYCYLQSAGNTRQEVTGSYLDDGAGFSLVATSAWLRFAGLQGYQRLWEFLLQGFFPGSASSIQIGIAYDYNPAIVNTYTFSPGVDVTQFRVKPQVQKCQALQFTIQLVNPTSATKALALNALDLLYGVKRGGNKIGQTSTVG